MAGARPSAQIQPSVPQLNSTRWVRAGFRQAGSRMVSAAAAVALCAPGLLLGAAPLAQSSSDHVEQPEAAPRTKPTRPARPLRLSDWLIAQPPRAEAYPLGLALRL